MRGRCAQCAAVRENNPDGFDKLETVDLMIVGLSQDHSRNALDTLRELRRNPAALDESQATRRQAMLVCKREKKGDRKKTARDPGWTTRVRTQTCWFYNLARGRG